MKKQKIIFGVLFFLFVLCWINLELNPLQIFQGFDNFFSFASDAIPPNSSVILLAAYALLETLQIAFLGTILGMILSLPLSLLASKNLNKKRVYVPIRAILAFFRTMPSLLWAVVFVIMIGFGPAAGVLATVMYTVGYLGKLQYESIEGLNPDSLEAISSTGAHKVQIVRFAVLPQLANQLWSQLLFMFEYNVRASSILGFVGAGGIGFYIMGYLRFLEYDKVLTLLILIYFTVLIIDYLSSKIRNNYLTNSKLRI